MNVSKDVLYKKFQDIIPGVTKTLKPEVLNSVCENKSVQPFLKWFVNNISQHNFLSEEDIEITKQIKKSGKWLSGKKLDDAVEEALKEYPELEEYFYSDLKNINVPIPSYELEKEEYMKDLEYLQFLQNQLKKLKKVEDQLDEQLEADESMLEKQQVEVEISYNKCSELLQSFDITCQEFSTNLKQLLEIYNDINNKGNVYTWVQMPLDIFVKQLETYSNYLDMYIQNEFGEKLNFYKIENNQTFLNLSESDNDEHMLKLSIYKNNLSKAKDKEISYKVEEQSWKESLQFLESIYNNGKLLKIPQNSSQFRMEMKEMLRKRDFMEENVELLNIQLRDLTENFSEMEMNKFLIEVAQDRIEYQKQRLSKLENLNLLARENGHAYSDLLCLLMSSQHSLITELYHFAKDARHYLQTEYSLADKRCEFMQKLQDEYNKILSSQTNEQNIFNKLFLNIMGLNDNIEIYKGVQEYESLVNENKENRKIYLESKCFSLIEEITAIDKDFSKIYLKELDNGLTRNFQSCDNVLLSKLEESKSKIENCQYDFKSMYNKFKEVVKSINNSSLEREKVILWQTFLVAPNLIESRYNELKIKADKSHFDDNL